MKLIVGLGNPGAKYEKARHNVGFLVVDALARSSKFQVPLRPRSGQASSKFKSELLIFNNDVIFVKPQTFMNLSGEAVVLVKNYYKIGVGDIWVVHDDVDLEVGRIKIQIGGGSAGHNGLNSIIEKLGTEDFVRFRVGIGRPENPNVPIEDFVLQNITGGEGIDECVKAICDGLEKGLEYAKSQNYSRKT